MSTYSAPLEDFRFLIKHYLQLDDCQLPSLSDLDEDIIHAVIAEAARFSQTALAPIHASGDAEGCHWEDGQVTTPTGFADAHRAYAEAGWPGLTSDPEYGGQGLPYFIGLAVAEILTSANTSWAAYPALSHGAWQTIATHGSDEQKQKFMPKMIAGEWLGTMNLTESQCGTDLGLIRTRAEPAADGSYRISGTKIWISAGEHDMGENIIHLVLARLPDAPAGTRGISLFIVPKFLVNDDGSLGSRNGVRCAGIEKKMGIHGSATCEMVYEQAEGYLLGEANRGLAAMFTMMNGARLETGIQGLGLANLAMQRAAAFARERLQGRALDGPRFPDKPADPIIVHPDVRRMLMTGKAFIEGARALGLYTALKLETEHRHPDATEREKAGHWVALMTPIIKAWFTDMGSEVANLAMQVHGGAGYIRDTGIEQIVRDVRITQIYEGTNGVQALDLVGRKLTRASGQTIKSFFDEVDRLTESAREVDGMAEFMEPLAQATDLLKDTTAWIYRHMASDSLEAGAAASDYLHQFALTAMAWSWAGQTLSALKLDGGDDAAQRLRRDKLATARFFMQRMLPRIHALDRTIRAGAASLMALPDNAF